MKIIKIIAVLMLLAVLFTGCDKGNTEGGQNDTHTDSAGVSGDNGSTDNGADETDPPENDAEFITLFGKDFSKDYVLIGGKHNAEGTVNLFVSKLMQKVGRTLKIKDSGTAETENEILIGYVANREESVKAYGDIAAVEYDVRFIDGKLTVSAYTSKGLQLALDYVAAYIVKNDDGEYGFMSDFKFTSKVVNVDYDIPKVVTKRGYVLDGSDSNSLFQLAYKNVTSEEVAGYGTLLKESGYTEHSTNSIGSNKFASYYNSELQVHTMYYPTLKDFRVVFGKKGYMPETTAPQFTRTNNVELKQILMPVYNSGMGYTMKLADGSFVVIDGGKHDGSVINNLSKLWNYLNTNKPASDSKPRVTWMFTHAHSDHMLLAINFLQQYSSKIDLQLVCYNFPNTGEVVDGGAGLSPYIKQLKNVLKQKYSNTETFIYHSGQKLLLPGVEIEFMATQEDFWPLEFTNENLTSNVWRMKFEDGRTCLIVGDLEDDGSERLTKVYTTELESDIFQVNHHGLSGMTSALINYVDPKICLWSITRAGFEDNNDITGAQVNVTYKTTLKESKWTRDGEISGNRLHYHGEYDFTITFTPSA